MFGQRSVARDRGWGGDGKAAVMGDQAQGAGSILIRERLFTAASWGKAPDIGDKE
jgi:hypothetical protein